MPVSGVCQLKLRYGTHRPAWQWPIFQPHFPYNIIQKKDSDWNVDVHQRMYTIYELKCACFGEDIWSGRKVGHGRCVQGKYWKFRHQIPAIIPAGNAAVNELTFNVQRHGMVLACALKFKLAPISAAFARQNPTLALSILYHFVQLVRVVTRDRLDEISDSSYWSYSRDIPSILSLRLMM